MSKRSANQLLADNLRRLMGERGLSNLALGKAAKLAPNTIKNYLADEAQVTSKGKERSAKLTEVQRLAEALDVSLIELLSEAPAPVAAAPGPLLTSRQLQLLDDLDDLPPPQQSQFVDQVHQAAESARAAAEHLSKKRGVVMAASMKTHSTRLSLTLGDGNPGQAALPLTTVPDPFTAEPDEREAALYERISSHNPRLRSS